MSQSFKSSHIAGIDLIRFFAALLVVMFHYGTLSSVVPDGYLANAMQSVKFSEIKDWFNFGWVGVEIFFVISGFVIAFSSKNTTPFRFLSSRIVRLAPGVWICASLTFLICMLARFDNIATLFRNYRRSILFSLFGPWLDGVYWTLGIETVFYACVFLILLVNQSRWLSRFCVVMGSISTLYWLSAFSPISADVAAPALEAAQDHSRLLQLALVQHGAFFAIGVLLWQHLCHKKSWHNCLFIAFFSIGGLLEICATGIESNTFWHTDYSLTIPCLVWLGAVLSIIASVRYNAVLQKLPSLCLQTIRTTGLMTFPLYLLHQIGGGIVLGYLTTHGLGRYPALFSVLALDLILVYLIARFLEPSLQRSVRYTITRIATLVWLSNRKIPASRD